MKNETAEVNVILNQKQYKTLLILMALLVIGLVYSITLISDIQSTVDSNHYRISNMQETVEKIDDRIR